MEKEDYANIEVPIPYDDEVVDTRNQQEKGSIFDQNYNESAKSSVTSPGRKSGLKENTQNTANFYRNPMVNKQEFHQDTSKSATNNQTSAEETYTIPPSS